MIHCVPRLSSLSSQHPSCAKEYHGTVAFLTQKDLNFLDFGVLRFLSKDFHELRLGFAIGRGDARSVRVPGTTAS